MKNAQLCLVTDISSTAAGAVLQQLHNNDPWTPVAFYSKKFSEPEERYSTFDRELLAINLSVKYFQHILEGVSHQ